MPSSGPSKGRRAVTAVDSKLEGSGALRKSEATAMAAAAGGSHSAAVGEDGSLSVWGYNEYGQLGTGDTARRLAPTTRAL